MPNAPLSIPHSAIGCLLGIAVGDAMGLPYEGLSPRRQRRLYPQIDNHHFLLGKGMVSDDTEHTCMVAQSLIASAGNPQKFARVLGWKLRFWLLGLPAGVGWATLRACVKLWLGFSSNSLTKNHCGVFSAGNGPAMRSAIIGVCYGGDIARLRLLVKASTRITHTDPKAEYGALAVALAARFASSGLVISSNDYYRAIAQILDSERESPPAAEFLELIRQACDSAASQMPASLYAADLGMQAGISGYIYRTVPVVIQVWLRHQQDYQRGIIEIIALGGDTDTTAAILGGIIGAATGKSGIPEIWLKNLSEWPRTVKWIEALGSQLARVSQEGIAERSLSLPVYGVLLRNLFFMLVVILHGVRRLLPPY